MNESRAATRKTYAWVTEADAQVCRDALKKAGYIIDGNCVTPNNNDEFSHQVFGDSGWVSYAERVGVIQFPSDEEMLLGKRGSAMNPKIVQLLNNTGSTNLAMGREVFSRVFGLDETGGLWLLKHPGEFIGDGDDLARHPQWEAYCSHDAPRLPAQTWSAYQPDEDAD